MQNAVASWHPCIPAIAKRYSDLDSQVRSGRVSLNDAVAQYAWVTKDRDGNDALGLSRLASAIPTDADDGELSIPFVITTFTEDRDGDVVRPQGIQLHNFANNPVCSFGHFQNPYYPLPVAKCKSPDGRLTINLEENRATCVMYFDREDEFAVKVYKKYKSGYLNATSIAFVPLQAQRRDREAEKGLYENRAHTHVSPMSPPGWRFDAVDLTEIACVPVPANAGAIRDWMDTDKGLTAAQRNVLLPYAAKSLGRSFSGWCPPGTTLCPDGTCKAVKSAGGAANVLPAVYESPADKPEVAVVAEPYDKLDRLITEVAKQNELLGKLLAKSEVTKQAKTANQSLISLYDSAGQAKRPEDAQRLASQADHLLSTASKQDLLDTWRAMGMSSTGSADALRGKIRQMIRDRAGAMLRVQVGHDGGVKKHGACGCGGEAACSCKRGTKVVEPILPKRSRGGDVRLPTRDVNVIYNRVQHDVFGDDPRLTQLPEWERWKHDVKVHYVDLRTVEERLAHRQALEASHDALWGAMRRLGVKPGGYYAMPDDGAKSLVKKETLQDCVSRKIPIFKREHPDWTQEHCEAAAYGYCGEKKGIGRIGVVKVYQEAGSLQPGDEVFVGAGSNVVGGQPGWKTVRSVTPQGKNVRVTFDDGSSTVWTDDKGVKKKQLAESSGPAGGYTVPVGTATDATTAQTEAVCPECGGSGECVGCNGAGEVAGKLCDLCGGSGECAGCAGAGMVAKSVGKSETLPQPSQAAGNAQRRAAQIAALKRRIQLLSSPTLDQRPEDKAKVEEYKRQLAELQGSKSLQQQPHNRIKNHMTQAR